MDPGISHNILPFFAPVPQAKNAMYHYIDSIVNGTPHTATGEEGLIVMEILDALYKSAAEGCPVKIK